MMWQQIKICFSINHGTCSSRLVRVRNLLIKVVGNIRTASIVARMCSARVPFCACHCLGINYVMSRVVWCHIWHLKQRLLGALHAFLHMLRAEYAC